MNNISIFSRLAAEWRTKLFLGGFFTCAFWIGYFLLQRYPVFPVNAAPCSIVDRLVPFMPAAAPIYASQFITMAILAWLMPSKLELAAFSKGIGVISGISFLVFFFYPTAVVRPDLAPGHYFIYDFVVRFDNPRNAFPSLHAAFAVYLAACSSVVFRDWNSERLLVGLSWLCAAAVLASTLLTKQHVFLDILAGSLLGGVGYLVFAKTGARTKSASMVSSEV